MSRNYPRKNNPVLSDLCNLWDSENSNWVLSSLNVIKSLFINEFDDSFVSEKSTQYSSPASGSTISLNNTTDNTHLILTPTASLVYLTVVLPDSVRDKQEILITCTQNIDTFTIDGNGASSVNGAPTALEENAFFTLKYDLAVNAWYRVG